jgi:hypothetical protein
LSFPPQVQDRVQEAKEEKAWIDFLFFLGLLDIPRHSIRNRAYTAVCFAYFTLH